MRKIIMGVAVAVTLSACAKTSVTPIANNQFLLSTSAAPACGRSGAAKVAAKMAAVETLRKGYPRFIILGAGSANNVRAVSTGPTYASTYGNVDAFGNYSGRTTFTGGGPVFYGTNDAELRVLMLKPGDQRYSQGVDAKATLGENWKEIAEKGVQTCS